MREPVDRFDRLLTMKFVNFAVGREFASSVSDLPKTAIALHIAGRFFLRFAYQ